MKNQITKCPNCGKTFNFSKENKWGPFCCKRCQLIDLGEWLNGNKRIISNENVDNDNFNDDTLH